VGQRRPDSDAGADQSRCSGNKSCFAHFKLRIEAVFTAAWPFRLAECLVTTACCKSARRIAELRAQDQERHDLKGFCARQSAPRGSALVLGPMTASRCGGDTRKGSVNLSWEQSDK
jgi:hypothetical protein